MSIFFNVVHSSWKLGEWIASLMKIGNCSISSLTIVSLLKLGLRDDRRPSMQHFFLVDLVELDRWVYPHPCQHSSLHTPQGWWYKYVPLEASNFVAIWCVFSSLCNASLSRIPGCSLVNLLRAVLATYSCALFSRFVHAFCLCAVLATSSCALFSRFVHAICFCAVSAACSCALFSGFVCAICLRSILATCSCVLLSRFVCAVCLCSVSATCTCILYAGFWRLLSWASAFLFQKLCMDITQSLMYIIMSLHDVLA